MNKLRSVSLVLIFVFCASPVLSVIKCDRSVLNNYGLSGAEYSTNLKMETCGFVHDRCCSIGDEVKLVNLWIKRTQPLLNRLTSSYIRQLEEIVQAFWSVARLDPRGILLKQIINKQTPTKEQICQIWKSKASYQEFSEFIRFYDSEYQLDRPYHPVDKSEHFENGRRHWGVYNNATHTKFFKANTIFAQNHRFAYYNRLKSVVKKTKDKLKNMPSHSFATKVKPKKTKDKREKMASDSFAKKFKPTKKKNKVSKMPSRSFSRKIKPTKSVRKRGNFHSKANKDFLQAGTSGHDASSSHTLDENSRRQLKSTSGTTLRSVSHQERILSEVHGHIPIDEGSTKLKTDRSPQKKINPKAKVSKKQISLNISKKVQRKLFNLKFKKAGGQKKKNKSKNDAGNESDEDGEVNVSDSTSGVSKDAKKSRKKRAKNNKDKEDNNNKNRNKNKEDNNNNSRNKNKEDNKNEKSGGNQLMQAAQIANSARIKICKPTKNLPKFEPFKLPVRPKFKFSSSSRGPDNYTKLDRPSITKMSCQIAKSTFNKDYLLINQAKTEFCLNIYKDFLSFEFEAFKEFIYMVKNQMNKVHHLKKYFYCAICDAHAIKYIDHEKKVMKYEHDFCHKLIQEHMDYLKFMHIVMVKFADSMIQYIQCYESDTKIMVVPFQNFLLKYKRRMPFFEKCFKEIESESASYFNSCWFICNKFSLVRISSIFDGDVALLQRIKVALLSFTRKFDNFEKKFERAKLQTGKKRNDVSADLAILNNVDGLMVEPVAAPFLITDNKFILNDADRPKILGKVTVDGFNRPNAQMELAVDNFLQALGMGNIDEIRGMYEKHWKVQRFKQKEKNDLENDYEGNIEAYKVSPVNNLINQLYNITQAVDLKDHMLPRRELKEKVMHILSESGFGPVNGERSLSLNANFTETFKYSPRKLQKINEKLSESEDQIVGKPSDSKNQTNFKTVMVDENLSEIERAINSKRFKQTKKEKPLGDNSDDLGRLMHPENFNELYEKEHPRTDLFNYGTAYDAEGFNPLKSVSLINFNADLTALIGNHFKPKEKIERDVIIEYVTNDSKRINQFNQEIDESILPSKEVEIRYKHITNYQRLADAGFAKKRPGLANEALNRQRHEIVKRRSDYNMERIRESNEKQAKELAVLKEQEKLTRKQNNLNDHIDHKNWNSTFSGIKELFKNLFGS